MKVPSVLTVGFKVKSLVIIPGPDQEISEATSTVADNSGSGSLQVIEYDPLIFTFGGVKSSVNITCPAYVQPFVPFVTIKS